MDQTPHLHIVNLARLSYQGAYAAQQEHHEGVLASRSTPHPEPGRLLFVEHPPVITVTRRPHAQDHITASARDLESSGVEVHQTDRGGDVTYHGPGQLVCYPIIDLNAAGLRIHDYIRLLESAVIDTMTQYGITSQRDESATGVWTVPPEPSVAPAKLCAIGVRVRKWITMHGLAINISTNLDHFNLIVPCGLAGRPVTSMLNELGADRCPSMPDVQRTLAQNLNARILGNQPRNQTQNEKAGSTRPPLA